MAEPSFARVHAYAIGRGALLRRHVNEAVEDALIVLGRRADVAESAALTLADCRATERIYEALEWEGDEKHRKGLIDNAIRRLAKKDRPFARSVLKGRLWGEMGISKQAFYCKLKKVCDLLETPVNRGRKRFLGMVGERVFG